jgi:hypothetical protein
MDVWSAKQQKDGGIRGPAAAQKPKPRYSFVRQDGDLKVAATKRRSSEAYGSN